MPQAARGAQPALRAILAARLRRGPLSPFRRSPLDVLLGPLDAGYFADVRRHGPHVAPVLALRPQSAWRQPAARYPGRHASTSSALAKAPIKLFVTATNVRTGRGRVFRNAELTPDVLLASACLPTMFQAVEIDGEAYWDGGYAGNPDDHAADPRMRVERHDPGADQSGRARRARRAPRATSSTA